MSMVSRKPLLGIGDFKLDKRQDSLPNCAVSCASSANPGSCGLTDIRCLCTAQDFIAGLSTCLVSNCAPSDLASAQAFFTAQCASVGVNPTSVSLPPSTAQPPSTSSSSLSSASSSTPSSPTGQPTISPPSSSSSSGLDAKILVAAIVPSVVALGALAVLFALFMRRRKKQRLVNVNEAKVEGPRDFNPQMVYSSSPPRTLSMFGAGPGIHISRSPPATTDNGANQEFNPYQFNRPQQVGQYPPPVPTPGLGLVYDRSAGSQMVDGYPLNSGMTGPNSNMPPSSMGVGYTPQQYFGQQRPVPGGSGAQDYQPVMQYSPMGIPYPSSPSPSPPFTGFGSPSGQSIGLPGYESVWGDSTTSGQRSTGPPVPMKDKPSEKMPRGPEDDDAVDHGITRGDLNVMNQA